MDVWICRLPEEKREQDIAAVFPYLMRERIARLQRFHRLEDQFRSALGDLLIRYLYQKHYGKEWNWKWIERNRFGKPYLSTDSCFHFNVSHAGEWIACTVHDSPVGIDIEQIKPIDYAAAFLTNNECRTVALDVSPLRKFYQIWTAKESFLKACGVGLSRSLTSFEVVIQQGGQIDIYEERDLLAWMTGNTYWVEADYALSVCAENIHETPAIYEITYQSLLSGQK
ncbi:4'-phosphopantetheinyl transferase superfamily protein [Gracilibacillus caseinilyticus]|uniref:4'-phosphopantetheinyl transferase superfamily protein n=1 Tax=Gracilibacillus caseinilyticus TaxID=2932256 RepID=A0ABY4EWK7_9BACI|nr:4'-phosphopantetheinyl transferase superfamily protein [Gracilibacillus caseinilyticus]UOQ48664.1 4'-phosphopantetheinyl transferase superfamily protein [Gracilibacillus caseinilyticus]